MLPDIPGDEIPPGSGCAGIAQADRAGNVKTGKRLSSSQLIPAHPSPLPVPSGVSLARAGEGCASPGMLSGFGGCQTGLEHGIRGIHQEQPGIHLQRGEEGIPAGAAGSGCSGGVGRPALSGTGSPPAPWSPPKVTPEPCGGVPAGLPPPRRRCVSVLEPGTAWDEEEEEEEEEERMPRVSLRRSGTLRSSLDPFRRHSWEPGKDPRGIPGYDQLSGSPELGSSSEQLGGLCQRRRDPRRAPLVHSSDELDSLLSQDEEDEADVRRAQEDARRLPEPRAGPRSRGWSRFKSASLGVIASVPGEEAAEIPPFASQQSLLSGAGSRERLAGEAGTPPGREGTPLDRTLSFIRRMTGKTKGGAAPQGFDGTPKTPPELRAEFSGAEGPRAGTGTQKPPSLFKALKLPPPPAPEGPEGGVGSAGTPKFRARSSRVSRHPEVPVGVPLLIRGVPEVPAPPGGPSASPQPSAGVGSRDGHRDPLRPWGRELGRGAGGSRSAAVLGGCWLASRPAGARHGRGRGGAGGGHKGLSVPVGARGGGGKDKERMKEGKEKDARYTNGHLFTTISVS
ncbi:hypothetical protein DV515_00017151, partial [Chloebia gouldiae]